MNTVHYEHTPNHPFVPSPVIRHAYLQTGLTTVKLDISDELRRSGLPVLVDAGPDELGNNHGPVQLLAYYSPPVADVETKGAAILLHGWEGTSQASYCLITSDELNRAGYHVIRLNLRDHGPNLHVHAQALNAGVFLGTLLDESITAIIRCAEFLSPLPVYLIGYSMGGNFALRTAAQHAKCPIPGLQQVIAVNPAINPLQSTLALEGNPILRRHFRRPWLHQLLEKQKYYPELYDFSPLEGETSLIAMTNWLVDYLGLYRDAEDYFNRYSFLGNDTRSLTVDTRIVASVDDPICPVDDFYSLAPSPYLTVDIHPYGGHVGYVDLEPIHIGEHNPPLVHRVGEMVLELVEDHLND